MTRAARWLLACALVAIAPAARAQDAVVLTGTLKVINERGTILIGYREDAVPFSFVNKAGQPVGFAIDLCHGIAQDVATLLHRDLVEADAPAWQTGVRIAYVPVRPEQRLPMVISGAIDLECSSTTANAERAKVVAFSPVFYLAGTKLLVPIAPNGATPSSYRDLAGHTVAVSAQTTNAAVVHRLAGSLSPPKRVAETAGLEAAYTQLKIGQADAFASDDVLLAGLTASHGDTSRFRLIGDFLSFEPYAITIRRGDPAFGEVVERSFGRMAGEGLLTRLYKRWLEDRLPGGETIALPISAQLAEIYRALGQPD